MKPNNLFTTTTILLLFCCQLSVYAQEYGYGCVIDEALESELSIINPNSISPVQNNIAYVSPVGIILQTPPVGDQCSQGSCCAWAVGYAAGSILSYDKYGKDWNVARRSPSYIYNQLRPSSDCDEGISIASAVKLLGEQGICSYNSMPYRCSDCSTQPNAKTRQEASYNKFRYGKVSKNNLVSNIRSFISKGIPVIFDFKVSNEYYNAAYGDGIITSYTTDKTDNSYHACCFVGWDDEKGMFKVQNSWGTNRGDNGFLWVSYNAVPNMVRGAFVIFPVSNPNFEFEIEGSSVLCSTETYTIKNCPSTATVTWNVPRSNLASGLVVQSLTATPAGSKVTIVRKEIYNADFEGNIYLTRYTGDLNISATVTLNGATYNLEKDLFVGTETTPALTMNGKPASFYAAQYYMSSNPITVNCNNISKENLDWVVNTPEGETKLYSNVSSVTHKPAKNGNLVIRAINKNGCPDDNYTEITFRIAKLITEITPVNPVQPGTNIQATIMREIPNEQDAMSTMSTDNEPSTTRVPYDGDFVIELWSNTYGRVATYEGSGSNVSIPSTGLMKGTYVIKLIIDGEQAAVANVVIN